MSEHKHTPGPWIADVRNENCAYIEGPPTSYDECYFKNAADARLIAAAPDLLAALQAIVSPLGGFHCHTTVQDQARAAITRATGASDAA